jgi:hypothetical protein
MPLIVIVRIDARTFAHATPTAMRARTQPAHGVLKWFSIAAPACRQLPRRNGVHIRVGTRRLTAWHAYFAGAELAGLEPGAGADAAGGLAGGAFDDGAGFPPEAGALLPPPAGGLAAGAGFAAALLGAALAGAFFAALGSGSGWSEFEFK